LRHPKRRLSSSKRRRAGHHGPGTTGRAPPAAPGSSHPVRCHRLSTARSSTRWPRLVLHPGTTWPSPVSPQTVPGVFHRLSTAGGKPGRAAAGHPLAFGLATPQKPLPCQGVGLHQRPAIRHAPPRLSAPSATPSPRTAWRARRSASSSPGDGRLANWGSLSSARTGPAPVGQDQPKMGTRGCAVIAARCHACGRGPRDACRQAPREPGG
jgi:hypothetical protein